ncbi:MAG TPA: phage/plasmid primase, P4 family [Balneolaceae bacterium]|nr:phage/plasmid primase, P4 family [Balneolaceae bacterium]
MQAETLSTEELTRRFESIRNGDDFTDPVEVIPHRKILNRLLEGIDRVNDFRSLARRYDLNIGEDIKLLQKHLTVLVIDHLLEMAENKDWGICKKYDSVYLFNGAYWKKINKDGLQSFLGKAAREIGINGFDAKHHRFRDELVKQFHAVAHLPTPDTEDQPVLINLKNGTVCIDTKGSELVKIRQPKREDFLTYQLPFIYDSSAEAPRFEQYLDKVLPDETLQKILAEFIGYVFVNTHQLKLEKALILHGSGGNGKSVFFDIINALLGSENVSTFTLESLTNQNGYYRAKLANKLVNYGSEISANMQTAMFKQLVSGEPVEARLPYGEPFTLDNYAKLVFNCNELPTDVEHTNAFFRRFMIIPFEVTIPEEEQDKELSKKIIENELPGVFNWVVDGLKRVLKQKGFTLSEVISDRNQQYRKESDSVQMFIAEHGYTESMTNWTPLKELYGKYKRYCEADGYYPVAKRKFSKRLEAAGYKKVKKAAGMSFHIINEEK